MVQIEVTNSLLREIHKKFGETQGNKILDSFESLKENPHKGKALGQVQGIVIKELKYGTFRFYFITDGHILKFGSVDEWSVLIIKFIKMSDKKEQKKTIEEIKKILKSFGFENF